MTKSIEQARDEVQTAFDRIVHLAESDDRSSFSKFEANLWSMLLALGRAVTTMFLARRASRPRSTEYRYKGETFCIEMDEIRTSDLGTRCGKVKFSRPVGRRADNPRAACDLPVDRELGLCSGFSLGVVTDMARLCAQMAYKSARTTFSTFLEWAPSPRAVMRMIDAVGAEARPFLEQVATPQDDGEILVIQVDARGAPMIDSEEASNRRKPHKDRRGTRRQGRRLRRKARKRPRRTKGMKSKNAKEAFVGVLYTLRQTPDGIEGPINKKLYATFESHEALFIWLRHEADKRGYGTKETFFLADGSDHIWRMQQRYFPDADACIDWYHIVEKLWTAGQCIHKEGTAKLNEWIEKQTELLRTSCIDTLIEGLKEELGQIPKTGPGNKGKRERLDKIIKHLEKNRVRMDYATIRERDLDIGSGAVEGAVRNLVGIRFDGPGMRWGRGRSELLLHLRCILLNEQWDEFVSYLSRKRGVRLAAQPIPLEAHDAKKVA
mgnify:FL=1